MTIRSYHDSEVHLALELPADWDAASTFDFALVLTAPEDQGVRASLCFNISPFDPATQERLLGFIQETRQERMEIYSGFTLLREDRIIQDHCPGYIETYHWQMEDTGTSIFQLFAVILLGTDALYTVHGTSLLSLQQTYEPVFRQIIASIQFIRDEN